MELNEALAARKSIRSYEAAPIDSNTLHELIEAAILAPSWKNSQTPRYYIVQTPEILKQVKESLPEFNQNNVTDAPVLIVTTVVLNRSGFNRDGTPTNELGNSWGIYDCGLQHANLMLKAAELGLGTLVMGIRDADVLRNVLNLPENEAVVSVIAVGKPACTPERPKRKSVEDVAHFV